MKNNLSRVAVALLVAAFAFLPDVQSQQRKRTSRRATSRVRPQPVPTPELPDEPTVVSTADDPQQQPRRTGTRTRPQGTQPRNNQSGGTERELSERVEQLTNQLNQMKADQRAMYDLERLTRAEQRAEELRRQLREITDKEFQLQERMAEIDYESTPDAIQRRSALIGSLNPGAVRDAIAQQLERERTRIRKQLELLGTSRARLETAVGTADAEVERLRQRVDAADAAQQQTTPGADAASGGSITPATPQPTPTPTPAQPPRE